MPAADLVEVLIEHWSALEADSPTAPHHLRTSVLPVSCHSGVVLAAVDSEGLRHILVPLAAHQRVGRRTEGVNLKVVETALETTNTFIRYVDVCCADRALNDLFSEVCSDILIAIEAAPGKALTAANAVIARWRSLFDSSQSPLGEARLSGLFAELCTLRDFMLRSPSAALSWTGPAGHCHDFSGGRYAVEVKSTTTTESRTVRIHGLDQLDAPHDGKLNLRWMRLAARSDGTSLGEIVDELLSLTDDPPAFLDKLDRSGFRIADRKRYQHDRFVIVDDRWFEVDTSFPKLSLSNLTAAGIPVAVSDVEYSIEIPDRSHGSLSSGAIEDLIENLVEELAG
ncbi:PD-(D/E)XK motif protein [Rhodococcus sp. DT1]|uniref:PD-(D/E)XK motif protein n=1 Tax=Rhodococcus sp. DT1 TaxID=3416544 RepID=UPI003CEEFD32